ncbi:MAG TPA: formate dehydrogenase accessory sulfurtransferase FdhD [Clostridiales bacterium]|nr:formate dehydrogenase accessory sulfurtransferase FdhD [Clostridiales bacterium]
MAGAGDGAVAATRRVIRYRGDEVDERDDVIAGETPFTIFLNGNELVTLQATPDHLDELAVGFLRAEGFIASMADVADLELDPRTGTAEVTIPGLPDFAPKFHGRRVITPGCAGALSLIDLARLKPFAAEADQVFLSRRRLEAMLGCLSAAPLFRLTGGTHSALLAWPEAEGESHLVLREDIGRHNAVDKVVGRLTLDGIPLGGRILATSGRVAADLVKKAVGLGLAIIVSRSAPTSLAVELAERMRLTLVGFARGDRLNVYSGHERLRGGWSDGEAGR